MAEEELLSWLATITAVGGWQQEGVFQKPAESAEWRLGSRRA